MAIKLSTWDRLPAAFITIAVCLSNVSVYAAEASSNADSGRAHPVADAKKAAKEIGHGVKKSTKAIGHGFRDGTRAVGHGTRTVTREVGHSIRDGVHEIEGKKD